MRDYWKGKKVFITGVCGTIGTELIEQLSTLGPSEITGIDISENDLFFLNQKYISHRHFRFYLCDIKNKDQLKTYMADHDIIIHAAARKHVILNEISPSEAIYTNIVGTQNVIEAAIEVHAQKVVFTSSDKAVNPTNVMGTSKLMGERLMTAANAQNRGGSPIFSSTRFGNVLGSNGSVIPIFKNQIEQGLDLTLTDREMSRFVMTKEEAVNLVLKSVVMAKGGEVFVTKMPIIRIEDLAEAMIKIYKDRGLENSPKIVSIGVKPGEKIYEELINEEEVRRTVDLSDFFAVLPAFKNIYNVESYEYSSNQTKAQSIYRSDIGASLCVEELSEYLIKSNLI